MTSSSSLKRFLIALILSLFFCNCHNKKSAEKAYSFLKDVSKGVNKNCPIQVDSIIKLESTAALPNLTFRYNYSLKYDTVKYDIHEFEKALQISTLNSIKTNPDAQIFKKLDAIIEFNYSDTLGNYLFRIVIKPKDYKNAN